MIFKFTNICLCNFKYCWSLSISWILGRILLLLLIVTVLAGFLFEDSSWFREVLRVLHLLILYYSTTYCKCKLKASNFDKIILVTKLFSKKKKTTKASKQFIGRLWNRKTVLENEPIIRKMRSYTYNLSACFHFKDIWYKFNWFFNLIVNDQINDLCPI